MQATLGLIELDAFIPQDPDLRFKMLLRCFSVAFVCVQSPNSTSSELLGGSDRSTETEVIVSHTTTGQNKALLCF